MGQHGSSAAASPREAASPERRYSLVTALCMIMGVCIGSGIFFKADNVLVATGGSVALGVAMFCIASLVMVFGGLTLSLYAERGDAAGGAVAYAREFLPPWASRLFGWAFSLLYLPSCAAVLSWVVGVYACMAFGWGSDFAVQEVVGVAFLLACVGWNVALPRLSGWLQSASTLLKVIPLVVVGVVGIALGDPASALAAPSADIAAGGAQGLAWLAAAGPIAFSFDGWSPATSIAPELRDARRNLPVALTVAPLLVLGLYLAYFVGISAFLGPAEVMSSGDGSLALVFVRLFGEGAATVPVSIALVSVMGSANGVLLALLRMPRALALSGDVPGADRLSRDGEGEGAVPWRSALVALGAVGACTALHVATQTLDLLPNGDISEVAVAVNMLALVALYVRAVGLWRSGEAGVLRGLVAPLLATACSAFVGLSALSQPSRWPYLVLYGVVLGALAMWRRRRGGR